MVKPNIIFVITDDQGYGDLGCHGNKYVQTPNLDKFYEDSIRLTDYHVGPTCAPTRAGIMTGHYANSTGVWHTIGGRSLLRKNEWTLPAALKENGYETAIFGKWHLGDSYPYRPQDRGFNTTVVHGGGGVGQATDYWGNDYFDDTYQLNGENVPFKGYCTDVFFSKALDFIEENKENPFFCYIATNAPHAPYNVPKKYYNLYKDNPEIPDSRARFYGMITNIDENFGKLEEKLKELDLIDNTILIFMTDNGSSGGCNTDENHFPIDGYNAGLRGLKGCEYEGGHRVPFFIRYNKKNINGGKDVNDLCANIDIMPTILEFCGIEKKENISFDGTSIAKLLTGEKEELIDRCIVTDSQRVIQPLKWKQSSAMWKQWRLINGEELYDVEKDREQRKNIAKEYPDIVEKLRNEYELWWAKVIEHADEEIPLHIGDFETFLSPHDVRGDNEECAFSQSRIRKGQIAYSYWEIFVEEEGEYEFDVRRWPKSHSRNITMGIEEDDIEWNKEEIEPGFESMYSGGNALDIIRLDVSIGQKKLSFDVNDNMESVKFKTNIKKGNMHLKTIFTDCKGFKRVAYFVYIRKVSKGECLN